MSDTSLNDLFADAGLEDDALGALELTADTLGPAIMGGLGDVDIEAIRNMKKTEVTLIVLEIDDSYSIELAENTDIVILGHSTIISALRGSKASGAVLIATVTYNGGIVQPFVSLDRAVELNSGNYRPYNGTPLYDSHAVALAMLTAKAAELEAGGVSVRCALFKVTDGDDTTSVTHRKPSSVEPITRGLLQTESFIVGAMGISDAPDSCRMCGFNLKASPPVPHHDEAVLVLVCPGCGDGVGTDFTKVFVQMGIREKFILTPGNNETEIRQAFGTMSQSAASASQAAGAFSATAMSGFTS